MRRLSLLNPYVRCGLAILVSLLPACEISRPADGSGDVPPVPTIPLTIDTTAMVDTAEAAATALALGSALPLPTATAILPIATPTPSAEGPYPDLAFAAEFVQTNDAGEYDEIYWRFHTNYNLPGGYHVVYLPEAGTSPQQYCEFVVGNMERYYNDVLLIVVAREAVIEEQTPAVARIDIHTSVSGQHMVLTMETDGVACANQDTLPAGTPLEETITIGVAE